MDHLLAFGSYLNDCIDCAEESNRGLARKIACDPSYITHLIQGHREPSVSTLLALDAELPTFDAIEALSRMRIAWKGKVSDD